VRTRLHRPVFRRLNVGPTNRATSDIRGKRRCILVMRPA
jgi:hypothetical protein